MRPLLLLPVFKRTFVDVGKRRVDMPHVVVAQFEELDLAEGSGLFRFVVRSGVDLGFVVDFFDGGKRLPFHDGVFVDLSNGFREH